MKMAFYAHKYEVPGSIKHQSLMRYVPNNCECIVACGFLNWASVDRIGGCIESTLPFHLLAHLASFPLTTKGAELMFSAPAHKATDALPS